MSHSSGDVIGGHQKELPWLAAKEGAFDGCELILEIGVDGSDFRFDAAASGGDVGIGSDIDILGAGKALKQDGFVLLDGVIIVGVDADIDLALVSDVAEGFGDDPNDGFGGDLDLFADDLFGDTHGEFDQFGFVMLKAFLVLAVEIEDGGGQFLLSFFKAGLVAFFVSALTVFFGLHTDAFAVGLGFEDDLLGGTLGFDFGAGDDAVGGGLPEGTRGSAAVGADCGSCGGRRAKRGAATFDDFAHRIAPCRSWKRRNENKHSAFCSRCHLDREMWGEKGLVFGMAGGIVIIVATACAWGIRFCGDGRQIDGFFGPRSMDALLDGERLECLEDIVVEA